MAGKVKEFDTKDILQSLMSDQKKQQSSEEEIHRVIAFYGSSFTLNRDAPLAKVARKFQTETKVASPDGAFVLPPVLFAKMDSPGPLIETKYKIESLPALKYFVGGEEKASWQKECLPTTEDAIFTKVKEVGLRLVGGEDLVMAEKEKAAKEKAEKAKAEKEKAEKMKAEKEKAEKEKAEKMKAEKEKAEKVKSEKEKAEKMKAEKEKRRKRKLKKKASKKEKAEKDKQDKALASPVANGVVKVEVEKATPKKDEKPLAAVAPSIHVPAGEVTGNLKRNTNSATGQNTKEKTVKAPVKRFKPGQKLETAEDRRLEREQWLAQLARQREQKRFAVKENCCKGIFQRLCSECCHWTCPVMIALTVGIYFLLLFILTSEDEVEWFYFVGLGMAYLIYISIGYVFAPPRSLADGRTLDKDEIQEKIDSAREATSAKYGWIVTSYRSKTVIKREKRPDGKIYEVKKTERIKDSSHHCNGFLDVTSNTSMSCPLDETMTLVRVRLKMEIPRTQAYMDAFHRWAIDNSTTSDYEKSEGVTCDSIRAGEFEEYMCRWSQKRQCREAFLNQNAYWITLILLLNPLYRLVVATVTGLQTYTFRKEIVNFKV